jgi:hypothetical protein
MTNNKEALLNYRMDYSVYTLRVEKKSLGRRIRYNNGELSEDDIKDIRRKINQIAETLKMLRVKFKVNY